MAEEPAINKYQLLLVGGSAGSLEVILQLLPALASERNLAIVLVLHRGSGESLLVRLLEDKVDWPVKEAEEKEVIEGGTIYIAPADYHLLIEGNKTFSLDYSEKVQYSRPSIDVTFETAADVYKSTVIALLLSGANSDGTDGLRSIKKSGGLVMVQSPADAQVPYMPQSALDNVPADFIVAAAQIAGEIIRINREA